MLKTKNWKTLTIECISSKKKNAIAMGPFGSNITTDNFVPYGVPVIRGINLGNSKFNEDEFVYLTEKKADELRSANVIPGDIIFTHRGTLGQVAIIPYDAKFTRYVISQSQMKLSCDTDTIDPYFVYYYFISAIGQHELLANTSTTGVPALAQPLTSLKQISISIPNLSEQKSISGILFSIDNRIKIIHSINQILEKIIQTIYKSWFIDFDGQTEFVDSELGQIPNGWKIEKFSRSIELLYGKSLTSKTRIEGHVPVFGSSGIVGYHNESIVSGPGIIVGRKGNVGSIFWSNSDFYPIDTVYYVKSELPLEFVYYLLKTLNFINSDSSVPGLSREQAYSLTILIPHNSLLSKFTRVVNSFFHLKTINEKQIKILSNTRDSLLPKLMSGEIRIT